MDSFTRYMLFVLCYGIVCDAWKAVPANQAMYSLRQNMMPEDDIITDDELSDEKLPRRTLNSIYKFGWCTADAISHQYLRKSVNITMPSWQSTQLSYIYLLAKKNTINFDLQCVVMKSYVPAKYMFLKSRLPLYYCQGTIFVLMLNTINRYEIHEFYFHKKLNMPINFNFEFYHPMVY